jgi:hypothetical protein
MAPPKILPPAEYLHQCFIYDPETGVLTWKHRPRKHFDTHQGWAMWNGKYAGTIAGSMYPRGYLLVFREHYLVHRCIWKMVTGKEPPPTIDHINGNPTDNRWSNLRAATQSQQLQNRTVQQSCLRPSGKWEATIRVDGRRHYLGLYPTREEATAAYEAAARKLFGEFYRE